MSDSDSSDVELFSGAKVRWFFINRSKDFTRRVRTVEDLAVHHIRAERFAAHSVESRKLFPEIHFASIKEAFEEKYSVALDKVRSGQIGCFLSHYDLLCQHSGRGYHVAVFEDDVKVCKDFGLRLQLFDAELTFAVGEKGWDIAYLSAYFHDDPPYNRDTGDHKTINTGTNRLHRLFGSFTAHAYIVHKDSVQRLIALLRQSAVPHKAIDDSLMQFQATQMRSYCFVPGMSTQYDGHSIINTAVISLDSIYQKLCGRYTFTDSLDQFYAYTYPWKF